MKKNIFVLAAAFMAFAMTSCQPEEPIIIDEGGMNNNTELVKSAADLIGTEWEYTLDLTANMDQALLDCMDSATIADMLTLTFGLNFDADYAHLTFPENVIGLNVVDNGTDYTVEEIQQMNYVYTYDPSTHTGTLTGGNLDDMVLPFTYDATTDGIVVEMMVAYGEDDTNPTPFQLVFHRAI